MKRLLLLACLALLPASGATALDCIGPRIEDSYQRYSEAKETYILVLGELVNKRNVIQGQEKTRLRGARGERYARAERYVATFKGFQAARSGFDRPLDITVAVKGTCLAVWCGGVTSNREMLAFMEKTPHGYTLSEGPCGGAVFYDPSKNQIERALQCLLGGVCEPDNR